MKTPKPAYKPGGKTQQHMKEATDINYIMERARQTGAVQGPGVPSGRQPRYMTLTGDSFHEMLIKVQEAQQEFASMPARTRRRFQNNPELMVRFCEDPNNFPEMVNLGLVQATPEQQAQLDMFKRQGQEDFKEWNDFQAWRKAQEAARKAKPGPTATESGTAGGTSS